NPIKIHGQDFQSENLFYITNSSSGITSFRQHAEQISIIVPAVYHIDKHGVITGNVDSEIINIALSHNVKVMPIVSTFDHVAIHRFLTHEKAMKLAIRQMVHLAKTNDYY